VSACSRRRRDPNAAGVAGRFFGQSCHLIGTGRAGGPVAAVVVVIVVVVEQASGGEDSTLAPDARFRRNAPRALRQNPVFTEELDVAALALYTNLRAGAPLLLARAMAPAVTMRTRLSETTAAPTALTLRSETRDSCEMRLSLSNRDVALSHHSFLPLAAGTLKGSSKPASGTISERQQSAQIATIRRSSAQAGDSEDGSIMRLPP
jgi:hypothetical protein